MGTRLSFDLLLCDVTLAVMSRSLTDTRKQWSHPLPPDPGLHHYIRVLLLCCKNLKKIRRDSNDSTLHYPTDFPIYIQIEEAVDSQQGRGLNIERNQLDHARTNQSHVIPSENHQVPLSSSIGNNSISGTRARKRRKTRHSRKSTSYAKRKAPIRLDTCIHCH